MANTTFTQETLDKIEAVITQAVLNPKEAVKGSISLAEGQGALQYRSFDELLEARNNIKKIIDNESNLDLSAVKASAYRPFTPTLGCQSGNS